MSVINLNHLTKRYKNGRGVHDISLSVEKGQIFGLLGPNGSGKTTIMKSIVGLIFPDDGEIKLLDQNPVDDIENALREVGCLIETPSYYPYLSARQNLTIIQKLYPTGYRDNIEETLSLVGLLDHQHDKVNNYSLGMKQRLGLAMAMLTKPQILILDEPSNGLDIEGMAQIRSIIKTQSQNGNTILISSHLAAELEQICTHLAVIKEGRLLASLDIQSILTGYGSIEKFYLSQINMQREVSDESD